MTETNQIIENEMEQIIEHSVIILRHSLEKKFENLRELFNKDKVIRELEEENQRLRDLNWFKLFMDNNIFPLLTFGLMFLIMFLYKQQSLNCD